MFFRCAVNTYEKAMFGGDITEKIGSMSGKKNNGGEWEKHRDNGW